MHGHTLSIATSSIPAKIEYPSVFNAAVPFIDRHLGEGRGEKTAIQTSNGETVNYSQLSERVNRCGNALRDRKSVV